MVSFSGFCFHSIRGPLFSLAYTLALCRKRVQPALPLLCVLCVNFSLLPLFTNHSSPSKLKSSTSVLFPAIRVSGVHNVHLFHSLSRPQRNRPPGLALRRPRLEKMVFSTRLPIPPGHRTRRQRRRSLSRHARPRSSRRLRRTHSQRLRRRRP